MFSFQNFGTPPVHKLEDGDRAKLTASGFEQIDVQPTRIYSRMAREFLVGNGLDFDAMARSVDGKFMSAFIRGVKRMKSDGA